MCLVINWIRYIKYQMATPTKLIFFYIYYKLYHDDHIIMTPINKVVLVKSKCYGLLLSTKNNLANNVENHESDQ